LLFILALFISVVFSFDKLKSFAVLHKYFTGLMIFTVSLGFLEEEKLKIVNTVILAGVIIGSLAIYQYFFGIQYIVDYINKQGITDSFAIDYIGQKRVFFPFVTPNALASYLILIIPLVLILKEKTKWIILFILSVALLFTKSFGAFLSLFVGAGLYLCLKKDMTRKEFTWLATIEAIGVLLFILRQITAKAQYLPTFSFARRLSYWQDALRIIWAFPLVGVGIGNFNLPLSRYAHNIFLQIWAETGILGLFSFIWLIVEVMKSALKNMGSLDNRNRIALLLTAIIIFLIHNLFDFSFFLPEIAILWWIILGMIIS
jgi:putative inorganic carbon (HCO3(-)) transporter